MGYRLAISILSVSLVCAPKARAQKSPEISKAQADQQADHFSAAVRGLGEEIRRTTVGIQIHAIDDHLEAVRRALYDAVPQVGILFGEGEGVVKGLFPEGPAEQAGIQPGDRIVRVNGRNAEQSDTEQIINSIRATPNPVRIAVRRGNKEFSFQLTKRPLPLPPIIIAELESKLEQTQAHQTALKEKLGYPVLDKPEVQTHGIDPALNQLQRESKAMLEIIVKAW